MRVLVTEAAFGESASVVDALRAAGLTVSTCHGRSGVCRALEAGQQCPLDAAGSVDLVVDVRGQEPDVTAREFGLVCAVRGRVPVAVVGVDPSVRPRIPAGLAPWVTVTTLEGLLSTCRDAVMVRSHHSSGQRRPLPVESW